MENFVVYGLGKSGISALKALSIKFPNHKIIGTDDNLLTLQSQGLNALLNQFPNLQILTPNEIKFNNKTKIIFSPGIALSFPGKVEWARWDARGGKSQSGSAGLGRI